MNISERLDRIASHLESLGVVKEAEELDVVSNTLEAGVNSQEKPGWLANKVEVITRGQDGVESKRDENRVYTDTKPSKLSELWKEGPDGNWYLQNAGDKYSVSFEGTKGYLEGVDGSRTHVPGLKIVTDL